MVIHNFLLPDAQARLSRGDVVFCITEYDKKEGRRVPRRTGHAGLVLGEVPAHSLGGKVIVYEMLDFLRRGVWADLPAPPGEAGDAFCADLAGSVDAALLDIGQRNNIVDRATSLFARQPTNLDPEVGETCYLLGPPMTDSNPLHPQARSAYAFSCTSFVSYCYEAVIRLVDWDDLPDVDPGDDIRRVARRRGMHMPPGRFRLLTCGHLISAFQLEQYPLRRPRDWHEYSDASIFKQFIPSLSQKARTSTGS